MVYDISIIGAGVIGSFIARELSRYQLNVCVIEQHSDVAMETSKANSGIVHAGYDAPEGSNKAIFNVQGNAMLDKIAEELDIPFKRIGSLVIAFSDNDMDELINLYNRGISNGVKELRIISKDELCQLEPNISPNAIGALLAPTGGIICPYELTIGAIENAVSNGVKLLLNTRVTNIVKDIEYFKILTSGGEIRSRYIINSAGLYADDIARMLGDNSFNIVPRKGEYMLLDKKLGTTVKHVVFQTPTKLGKGILVTPTVDGNLLIGPTAKNIDIKDSINTSSEALNEVITGAQKTIPNLNTRDVITSFSGLRSVADTDDFIIKPSDTVKGMILVAGIQSPGLTSAPAIATYVVNLLEKEGVILNKKESFNPIRKAPVRFREMDNSERENLIKSNSMYGRVICRCETVTEGEIVDSIRSLVGATDLDGVKRRTRSGMGRCQGGFCSPKIVEILARELDIPLEEVTKMGGESKILIDKTK